jgi:hypothetical protein
MSAPSAWTLQQVMSIAQATLARMEADGTLDTDEAALMDVLRQEVPEVDEVITRLLRARGEARAYVEAIEARMDDLAQRANRYAKQADAYRAAVYAIFDALGMTKWKHAEFTAGISPGRPGVVITDPDALPDAVVKVTRTPDRTAIKEALAHGEVVPGAELSNGLPTMTVRTK